MNSERLWSKRAGERFKELFRYSRYMLNDHLLFVLIIGIGGGAYYYQKWVTTLSTGFPVALVFSVVFGFLLTWGNVITFFKEPDKVFLLPLEKKLGGYIRRSFLLTVFWHFYITILCLLILAPLFLNTTGSGRDLLLFSATVFLLKIVNVFIRWAVDYETDSYSVIVDFFVRLFINGTMVYFYLKGVFLLFWVTALILAAYGLYFQSKNRGKPLPWERLISNEERRMGNFYRLANLFTDVPQLRNEVKRRKWLDIFVRGVRFSEENTYDYLLLRTFLRSGDYFGLVIRLTVIGSLILWGLGGALFGYAATVLFMYLTGIQLWGLWKHHGAILWTRLYPVMESRKDRSYLRLLAKILVFQMTVFTIIQLAFGGFIEAMVLLVILSMFIYFFVYIYSKNRLKKWQL